MNSILKYITLGAIIVICQIMLGEYVNIWAMLYIAIFPQFIILLPPSINRSLYMVIAFLFGLSIDLFSDGVLGLNAAALVAMAYTRPIVLRLTLPRASFDNYENVPLIPRTVEIPRLLLINAIMLAVFFTVYIMVDSAVSFSLGYTILKLLLCVTANTILAIICNIALLDKILK